MTKQATSIRRSRQGARALIGATAAGLVLVGGAALWELRSGGTETTDAGNATTGVTREAEPKGGMAELHGEGQKAQATSEATRVTTRGGLAERYAEEQEQARVAAALAERMGGMAELYRDQALAAGR